MIVPTWKAFMLLGLEEDIEFLNDDARHLLGFHLETPVTITFRQFLRQFALGSTTVRKKTLSDQVAVFSGDLCAFTASETVEVHHGNIVTGEILVFRRDDLPFQDEPSIHAAISRKTHRPILSTSLTVETLTEYDHEGVQQVLKETTRLNLSGLQCFKRIVSELLLTDRPLDNVNQLLVWPNAPASLIQWIIKTKGWAEGLSIISLAGGNAAFSPGKDKPAGRQWQLLQLNFTSLRLEALTYSTFSESTDHELLWLIPASAHEYYPAAEPGSRLRSDE